MFCEVGVERLSRQPRMSFSSLKLVAWRFVEIWWKEVMHEFQSASDYPRGVDDCFDRQRGACEAPNVKRDLYNFAPKRCLSRCLVRPVLDAHTGMIRSTFLLAFGQLVVSAVSAINISPSFENTAIIRQVELDGATVHVTTSYTLRSLSKNNGVYYISIPKSQDDVTHWVDAKLKGSSVELPISKHGIEAMLSSSECVSVY